MEVYEDGESFNIDLVEEEDEPSLGIFIVWFIPNKVIGHGRVLLNMFKCFFLAACANTDRAVLGLRNRYFKNAEVVVAHSSSY